MATGVEYSLKQIDESGVIPVSSNYRDIYDPNFYERNLLQSKRLPAWDISNTGVNVGDITQGKDTRYSETMGDISYMSPEEYQDELAKVLTTWQRIGNAALNNVVIAGTTAASGVLGIADALIEGTWDNYINNLSSDLLRATSEAFPIYRDSGYKDLGLLKLLGTDVFWADLLLNLGFTEGMLLPGMGAAKLVSSAPKFVRSLAPLLASSISEASVEAVNNKNENIEAKNAEALSKYREGYINAFTDGERQLLSDAYKQDLQNIESDEKKAGNFVFGSNIALLMLTNTIEFGKLFSKGYDSARRIASTAVKDEATGLLKLNRSKAGAVARGLATGFVNAASEAFEEGSQDWITKVPALNEDYNQFNSSIYNKLNRELASSLWLAAGMAFSETMKDSQTYTDMATGFITGLIGMPTFRGKNTTQPPLTGLFGELYSSINSTNRARKNIEEINTRLQDDKKLNAYYNGLVRHLAFLDRMNKAIDDSDQKTFKDAQSADLISDIVTFDEAGQISLLKELVNNSVDLSDEGIQNIIEDTTKDGQGPFIVDGNPMTIEEVKSSILSFIDDMNHRIDDYQKDKTFFLSRVPELTNETLKSVLFIKGLLRDWKNRVDEMSTESYDKLKGIAAQYPNVSEIIANIGATKSEFLNNLTADGEVVLDYINNTLLNKKSSVTPFDERQYVKSQLKDISRIVKDIDRYNLDLMEILLDPSAANLRTAELLEKILDEENRSTEKVDKADSYSEIDLIVALAGFDETILDRTINPLGLTYKKAKSFMGSLNGVINNLQINDLEKARLKEYANLKYNSATSYEELVDPTYEINDPNLSEEDTLFYNEWLNVATVGAIADMNNKSKINPNVKVDDSKIAASGESKNADDVTTVPPVNVSTTLDGLKKSFPDSTDDIGITQTYINDYIKDPSELNRGKAADKISSLLSKLSENADDQQQEVIDDAITNLKAKVYTPVEESTDASIVLELNDDATNTTVPTSTTKEPNKYYRPAISQLALGDPQFRTLAEVDPRYKQIYEYLQNAGAFDYINEGNLHQGDKLTLRVEKIGDNEEIVMYHNDLVVGTLPSDAKSPEFVGLSKVKERVKQGDPITLTVSKIMLGVSPYTRDKTRTLRNLADLTGEWSFGIVFNSDFIHPNVDGLVNLPFNISGNNGRVYLLVKNSRGGYSAKPVNIKHFNREEFDVKALKDTNSRAKKIDEIIRAIANATTPDDINKASTELTLVLNVPPTFHIYAKRHGDDFFVSLVNTATKNKISVHLYTEDITMGLDTSGNTTMNSDIIRGNAEEIYDKVLNFIYDANLIFNINKYLINKGNYNLLLVDDDILYTHLTSMKMKNGWFTTNYYDEEGTELKAVNPVSPLHSDDVREAAINNSPKVIQVEIFGRLYAVLNGVVYDVNQNEYHGLDELLVKDYADVKVQNEGRTNGVNIYHGRARVNGRYLDINELRYLTPAEARLLDALLEGTQSSIQKGESSKAALLENQKRILRKADGRPDNEETYKILEEDGLYHEYLRVHSVIGSNWKTSSSGSKFALEFGQLTDSVMRQLMLADNMENVQKPDKMSDPAFLSLKDFATKLKEQFKITGEQPLLDVNGIVVFHKYPDGTRIAGEVDLLTYNPYTGEFTIYDYKTSSYNFWKEGKLTPAFVNTSANQTMSNKDYYTRLQSAYKELFDSEYLSVVSGIALIPFVLNYNKQDGLRGVTSLPIIPLTYLAGVLLLKTPDKPVATPPILNPVNINTVPEQNQLQQPILSSSTTGQPTSSRTMNATFMRTIMGKQVQTTGMIEYIGDAHGVPLYLYIDSQLSKLTTAYRYYIVLENGLTVSPMDAVLGLAYPTEQRKRLDIASFLEDLRSENNKQELLDLANKKTSLNIQSGTQNLPSKTSANSLLDSSNKKGTPTGRVDLSPNIVNKAPETTQTAQIPDYKDLDADIRSLLALASISETTWNRKSLKERLVFLLCVGR